MGIEWPFLGAGVRTWNSSPNSAWFRTLVHISQALLFWAIFKALYLIEEEKTEKENHLMSHLPSSCSCVSAFLLVGVHTLQQVLNFHPVPSRRKCCCLSRDVWLLDKNDARHRGYHQSTGREWVVPLCHHPASSQELRKAGRGQVWRGVSEQMLFWIRRDEQGLGKELLAGQERRGCTSAPCQVLLIPSLRHSKAQLFTACKRLQQFQWSGFAECFYPISWRVSVKEGY